MFGDDHPLRSVADRQLLLARSHSQHAHEHHWFSPNLKPSRHLGQISRDSGKNAPVAVQKSAR
ncbi:hypothetical protein MES5069_220155 [Mesorhizobium escarrei]|uniref:Uncharacterized protein n=1 Tax=Mesorhizobium escarrei TaxID=666018 RepID=A0ABM9DS05_9HYPH|nr:hypothetical protein MES5069_220155 [Mesorhizobium escarrei]